MFVTEKEMTDVVIDVMDNPDNPGAVLIRANYRSIAELTPCGKLRLRGVPTEKEKELEALGMCFDEDGQIEIFDEQKEHDKMMAERGK
jgi:hypothetical protein